LNVFLLRSSRLHDTRVGLAPSTFNPRTTHPLLKYLPTKLAEFILDKYFDQLNLPESVYPHHNDRSWTVEQLNFILVNCLVRESDGTHLLTFGAVEWESETCEGTPRARCYRLKFFHGEYVQVRLCVQAFSLFQ
jgi:hypothetical protein